MDCMKEEKKKSVIICEDTHALLREYAQKHGYKMQTVANRLLNDALRSELEKMAD